MVSLPFPGQRTTLASRSPRGRTVRRLPAGWRLTDNDAVQVIRRLEEEDDEKIEEMIDDISTNEMFGSSILSNGDGDN